MKQNFMQQAKQLFSRFFKGFKQIFTQEHLDKTISGGIKGQLKLLLEVILVVFVVAALFVSFLHIGLGCNEDWSEKMWVLYNSFVDAGNQISQDGWVNRLIISIISLLGSILLGGVLISTISNIIERRVERIRSGKVYYKSINNHYIIIGYNYVVFSLVKELHKENKEAKIILMSDVDSESIRQQMQTQLSHDEERNVYIYFGNINHLDDLRKLNIDTAKEVYILGKDGDYGRDSKIIQIVRHINTLTETRSDNKVLPVYALFEKIDYYHVIQRLDILKSIQEGSHNKVHIYFRPFNLYENWARRLWSFYATDKDNQNVIAPYDSLDYEPICFMPDGSLKNADRYVHLVIIGFGGMGQALLLEALRVCHYANYDDNQAAAQRKRTKITVIDNSMDMLKEHFTTAFSHLDTQIDDIQIDYMNADGNQFSTQTLLSDWAKDTKQMLTIAICLSDPDESVRFGLSLPSDVYQTDTRILIRQDIQTDLGKIIHNNQDRYSHVKVFGMMEQGFSKTMLQDEIPSFINYDYDWQKEHRQYIKELYSCYASKDDVFSKKKEEAKLAWIELEENKRWSNRYQIDMYQTFLRTLGYQATYGLTDNPAEISPEEFNQRLNTELAASKEEKEKLQQQLLTLQRMEHHRWNAERTIAGWTYGASRDNNHLIHNLIVPFHKLQQNETAKDQNIIENLPYLLTIAGYDICNIKIE